MRTLFVSLLALCLSAPVFAAEARDFSVGGQFFSEADILDARALPGVDGTVIIMVTFSESAAPRFRDITAKFANKPLPFQLDGKVLAQPVMQEPDADGVVEFSAGHDLKGATALAKAIAGKDPLPESLEE